MAKQSETNHGKRTGANEDAKNALKASPSILGAGSVSAITQQEG